MAFCRFCGKQIPEGGACDCEASSGNKAVENMADSVGETIGNVQGNAGNVNEAADVITSEPVSGRVEVSHYAEETANAAPQTEEIKPAPASNGGNGYKQLSGADIAKKVNGIADGISGNLPGKMKNNKNVLYIAVLLAAILLVIILGVCCLSGGPKGAVKEYVKAASNKNGGKAFYSMTFPEAVIDELKDNDEFDDMVDDFNDMVEDEIDDLEDKETMPKFDKITRSEKLKNSEIRQAENYFKDMCDEYDVDDDDIDISKGYEVRVKTKNRDEDGDTDHEKVTLCVVKLKGDGWKIIPMSVDGLEFYD